MTQSFNSIQTLHNGVKIFSAGYRITAEDEGLKKAAEYGIRLFDIAADPQDLKECLSFFCTLGIQRYDCQLILHVPHSVHTYDETLYFMKQTLKILDTSYMDIVLLDCAEKTPDSRVWKALEDLYKAGTVHAIGTDRCTVRDLDRILAFSEISPMITMLNLYPGHPETESFRYATEHNIQIIAAFPEDSAAVLSAKELAIFANKYEKDPLTVCLRWQADKHAVLLLPSISRPAEELARVLEFELSEPDTKYLDSMKDYGAGKQKGI